MNALCKILIRDLKTIEESILNGEQTTNAVKNNLTDFFAKEVSLKAELEKLQNRLDSSQGRIEKRLAENNQLLTLEMSEEEHKNWDAVDAVIKFDSNALEKSKTALVADCDKCNAILAELRENIKNHISLRWGDAGLAMFDVLPDMIFEEVNVFHDAKNKGSMLVHVETSRGSFLCVMHDMLPSTSTQVSCVFSRISYMHKRSLLVLDPIAGKKSLKDLSIEESECLSEFNISLQLIRAKLRRMMVNTKANKKNCIQLPVAQPVQDIHQHYGELAWSLARKCGFGLLPIKTDHPIVQDGVAISKGAFKVPDDSDRIMCIGVMTFISSKLSQATLSEINMPDSVPDDSDSLFELVGEPFELIGEPFEDSDQIVSAVYNVKNQSCSDPVYKSVERASEDAKSFGQSKQVTLLLSALDRIEVVQEKLLGLTGHLKSFLKSL